MLHKRRGGRGGKRGSQESGTKLKQIGETLPKGGTQKFKDGKKKGLAAKENEVTSWFKQSGKATEGTTGGKQKNPIGRIEGLRGGRWNKRKQHGGAKRTGGTKSGIPEKKSKGNPHVATKKNEKTQGCIKKEGSGVWGGLHSKQLGDVGARQRKQKAGKGTQAKKDFRNNVRGKTWIFKRDGGFSVEKEKQIY